MGNKKVAYRGFMVERELSFGSITGLFGTVHTGLRSLILFAPRQSVQLTSAWRARAGGNRFWLPGCRRGRYSVSLFSAFEAYTPSDLLGKITNIKIYIQLNYSYVKTSLYKIYF